MLAEARNRSRETEWRRGLALAWNLAALMRVKELPPIAKLLEPVPPPKSEAELAQLAAEHADILADWERARTKE